MPLRSNKTNVTDTLEAYEYEAKTVDDELWREINKIGMKMSKFRPAYDKSKRPILRLEALSYKKKESFR